MNEILEKSSDLKTLFIHFNLSRKENGLDINLITLFMGLLKK